MTAKPKLEARLLKEAQRELRPPAKTRSKTRGGAAAGKRKPAAGARPAHGRRRSSRRSLPRACGRKVRRAGWDITAAVGNRGGRRQDRLAVPELKALLDERGCATG
jgi:hypothetical protein